MIRRIHVMASVILICWGGMGCIDEINIGEESDFIEKLVIDGQLRKGNPSTVQVQVSRSINFQSTPVTNFVSGGILTLVDDAGSERLIPEVEEGRFFASIDESDPFLVQTGSAYRIRLELEGSTYESTYDTIYAVPQADSLSFSWRQRQVLNDQENIVEENLWQLFIHTPLTSSHSSRRPALRWDFSSVWSLVEIPPPAPRFARTCYVSENLNLDEVVVFNSATTERDRIDRLLLIENPLSFKMANGQSVTVLQQSMSQAAYAYWDRVGQVISRSGGFLETPPGKIQGNLFQVGNPETEVLGLFYVSEVDTLRTFMQSSDFPVQLVGYCTRFPDFFEAEEPCQDCLRWPNSTYDPPLLLVSLIPVYVQNFPHS